LVDIVMFRVMSGNSSFATGIVDFSCVPEIEELQVRDNG